jgi:hypothetical protein
MSFDKLIEIRMSMVFLQRFLAIAGEILIQTGFWPAGLPALFWATRPVSCMKKPCIFSRQCGQCCLEWLPWESTRTSAENIFLLKLSRLPPKECG